MRKSIIFFGLSLLTATIVSAQNENPVTLKTKSGYININELSCGYGLGETTPEYSKYFYGLTSLLGYQWNIYLFGINSNLVGGIGAGMLFYNGGPLFPLYGDLRVTMNKEKVSPFIFARGGFLISVNDLSNKTRVFANVGGGINLKIDDHLVFNIGPGLLIQMIHYVSRDTFIHLNVGVAIIPRKHFTIKNYLNCAVTSISLFRLQVIIC